MEVVIAGFRCTCSPEIQPPTHYDEGCPAPPAPLRWIQRVLSDLKSDEDHAKGKLTVSRAYGCPRETIITDFVPVVINVLDLVSMAFGTAVHEYIGSSEETPRRLKGTLFGHEISGAPDEMNAQECFDIKTGGDTSHKIKFKEPPKQEVRAQVSMYLLLQGQQDPKVSKFGETEDPVIPEKLGTWQGAPAPKGGEAPPWYYREILPMSEKEIAEMRPLQGGYTVQEIVDMQVAAVKRIKVDKIDANVVAKEMPLVGASQKFGKKTKCDYCTVRETCDGLEGKRRI